MTVHIRTVDNTLHALIDHACAQSATPCYYWGWVSRVRVRRVRRIGLVLEN